MDSIVQGAPNIAIGALLGAALIGWFLAIRKWSRGQALIAQVSRPVAPWGLLDLLLAGVVSIVLVIPTVLLAIWIRSVILPMASQDFSKDLLALLTFQAVGMLTVMFVSMACLRLTSRADRFAFGFDYNHIGRDFVYALGGFCLLTFPVLLFRGILVHLVMPEEQISHPAIKLLLEDRSGSLLVLMAVATIVVAPLTEEYIFRVLLQGWFERVAYWLHRYNNSQVHSGPIHPWQANENPEIILAESLDGNMANTTGAASPNAARPLDVESAAPLENEPATEWHRPFWPIAAASLFFALAHWNLGLDPLPLFFLSLGLGYLYRQTGRIWPSLFLHAMFNGFTVLNLAWILTFPDSFHEVFAN